VSCVVAAPVTLLVVTGCWCGVGLGEGAYAVHGCVFPGILFDRVGDFGQLFGLRRDPYFV